MKSFNLVTLSVYITIIVCSCKTSSQTYECPINKIELKKLEKKIHYEVKTQYQVIESSFSKGDSVVITGFVYDRITGDPLSANVIIDGTDIGQKANSNGYFKLTVHTGEARLYITHLGSTSFKTELLKLKKDVQINICLGTTVIE